MASTTRDHDMIRMARRARTVLASGRTALLTLPCEEARGWVGLIDDGGEPLLMVDATTGPVHAASRGRRIRVDVPGRHGERLILTGCLRVVPGTTDQILGRLSDLGRSANLAEELTDELRVLAVSVDDVVLCLPAAPETLPRRWPASTAGRRVDLSAYAFAEPDLISAYAPDLIDHLNAAHAEQMQQLARIAGRPAHNEGEIAGVQVSGLDRTGMDLWRVTTHGAERVRVTFRRPLTEPRSLGRELRWLLDRTADSSE